MSSSEPCEQCGFGFLLCRCPLEIPEEVLRILRAPNPKPLKTNIPVVPVEEE